MLQYTCVISRFLRGVNGIFALLEIYAASIGIVDVSGQHIGHIMKSQAVSNARHLKMGPIYSPETSVNMYKSRLRKIPEDRRSYSTVTFSLYCRNTASVPLG